MLASSATRAEARQLKLWPLFDYVSDPATNTLSVKVFGPLLEYASDSQYRSVAFRPFLSVRQARVGRDDEVDIVYPLIVSRWQSEEQSTRVLGGLLSYRTTTTADGTTLTSQRFRALPVYFYDWDGTRGGRASLVPVYADLEDVGGVSRLQMVLFPAYLRVVQPDYERRFWLYPFYGEVGGARGSGRSVWPAYGWMHVEGSYDGGYTAWPFYIWDARTRDGETERRFTSFPFYSTVDGPRRQSVAYGTVLYVHTRDQASDLESYAFPWPLWEYERRISTGAPVVRRFLPFYDEHRQDDGLRTYRRIDGLLVLLHDEHVVSRTACETSHTFALFPGVVDTGDENEDSGGAPALLDAMFPHDESVRELYAPLWNAYAWDGPRDSPRVSIGWGAITRAGGATTYPWRFDPPDLVAPAPPPPSEIPPAPDAQSAPKAPSGADASRAPTD